MTKLPISAPTPRTIRCARHRRAALLQGTALCAATLLMSAASARAQLSPIAHPAGGVVVGGQAGIAQAGNTTIVNQASQNAAINWQSFNVGSQAGVTFNQPNGRAIALNRVVGPNPSEIAGHITANGQVVIVNQSGVVFDQGAQVDTAGLVVSAAGISNANFMAGHMVFDQAAHPGARVVNSGTITVRQAGLAALVAPQVANTGLIQATLGRVVLGGAATYTLDLYGDGLLALDVTGQVTSVSLGGRIVPALVTNAGLIVADGGTVLLTAQAADGLIRTLVSAGGTIAARGASGQGGRILAQGIGGGVEIDGVVDASATAPGGKGGQVVADATGDVVVNAGARIDARGAAGGGLIAIGTTAARAAGGSGVRASLTARAVSVAAGAVLDASATQAGNGGRITLLSQGETSASGAITLRGGPGGGDGGAAEVSGATVDLGGAIDAGAARGRIGSLLIDPKDIYIEAGPNMPSHHHTLTTGFLEATGADVTLAATQLVDFAYTAIPPAGSSNLLDLGAHGLTVMAGNANSPGSIDIDRGFAIRAGAISMAATGGAITFDTTTGVGLGLGPASTASASLSGGSVSLSGDAGLALAGASIGGSTSLTLSSSMGAITGTGVLTSPLLAAAAQTISLTGANALGTLVSVQATTGDIVIGNAGALAVDAVAAPGGNITLSAASLDVQGLVMARGLVTLSASTGDILEAGAGAVTAATLSAMAINGGVTLGGSNAIRSLGAVDAGSIQISDGGNLSVDGSVVGTRSVSITDSGALTVAQAGSVAGGITSLSGDSIAVTGSVTGTASLMLTANTGALTGTGVLTTPLATLSASTGISLTGANALVALGPVTTASGDVTINDARALTAAAITAAHGNVALSASGIDLTGPVQAAGNVSLIATVGDVTETGLAAITATSISGSAVNGTFGLGGPNAVGTLGSVQAGTIVIANQSDLVIDGSLVGTQAVTITDIGALSVGAGGSVSGSVTALSGDSLSIAGAVTGTTSLMLTATTDALTGAGVLTSSLATVSAGTGIDLEGANVLVALGPVTSASGDIVIDDGRALTVAAVTAALGNVTLSASALDLTGLVQASGNVFLTATGSDVTETGTASIKATRLSGDAVDGTFSLGGPNAIGTLGSLQAGTIAIANGSDLVIDGPVAGTLVTITALGALSVGAGGSVTGGVTALGGGSIAIAGAVTGSTSLTLTANTGALTGAGVLTSSTATLAAATGIDLPSANTLTALAAATTSAGDIRLDDAGKLTIGNVSASLGNIALSATGLDVTGAVLASGTIQLIATGSDIVETGAGSIGADTLTGDTVIGLVDLTGANRIGTVSALISGGNLTLDDLRTLNVAGVVSGGGPLVRLEAPTLNVLAGADLRGAGLTVLRADQFGLDGGIHTGSGGSSYTGTVALDRLTQGALILGGAGSSFDAAGVANIHTGTLLLGSQDGVIASGNVSLIQIATALDLTGVAGTLGLFTTGAGSVLATAPVTVGTVFGTSGDFSLNAASNAIGTLASLSAQTLAVSDGTDLSVTGPVSARTVSITDSGNLSVSGPVTGLTSLTLTATSGSLVATGALTSPLANFSAGTGISLTSATNRLDALGPVSTVAGDIVIDDGVMLTAAGIAAPLGNVTLSALDLALTGLVTANANVSLTATRANIAESGAGVIQSATLSGSAAGSADLGGGNLIGAVTSFSAGSHLTIDNAQALTVVDLTTTKGDITLSATGLTLTGSVLSGNDVALTATGGDIVESGVGLIRAVALSGTAMAGLVDLEGANRIGTVTSFTAGGNLTIADAQALGVGDLTASNVTLLATGLALSGTVTAQGNVSLTANAGDIEGAAGVIDAPTVSAQAIMGNTLAGAIDLTGVNMIGAVTSATADGDLTINDLQALGAGNLTSTSGNIMLSATSLTLTGTVLSNHAVSLAATTGGIAEAGTGLIQAATLSGGAKTGSVDLEGANLIGTVTAIAAGGDITIDNAQALTVVDLSAPTGNIAVATANGLSLIGTVTAGTLVSLATTGGAIDEAMATGVVDAAFLSARNDTGAAADIDLRGANQIGATTRITAGLDLYLNDTRPLTVGILTSAPLDIDITAPAIALTGLAQAGVKLSLAAGAGDITEVAASGVVETAALFASATMGNGLAGTVDLPGANLIGDVVVVTADGDVTINDARDFNVGDVATSLGNVALSATSLSLTGSVLSAGNVSLVSTAGDIAEAGVGLIKAAVLSGNSAGGVNLASFGNMIGTLGGFTAAGFVLDDALSLSVAGALQGGGAVTIASQGDLTVPGSIAGTATMLTARSIGATGSIDAPTRLSLVASGGGITTTGNITSGLLTGRATGSASFTGAERIGALGDFNASGFTLADQSGLTVLGAVSGGPSVAISANGALSVPGSVSGAAARLAAASIDIAGLVAASGLLSVTAGDGAITAAGSVQAGTLTGSATGGATLNGGNAIATLGNFASAGLTLNDGAALNVAGTVDGHTAATIDTGTFSLAVARGASVQGGMTTLSGSSIGIVGTIDAAALLSLTARKGNVTAPGDLVSSHLTLSASGAGSLTGANQLAEIDGVKVGKDFMLLDTGALRLAGPVTAGTGIALETPGTITFAGAVNAPNIQFGMMAKPSAAIVWDGGSIVTASGIAAGTIKPAAPKDGDSGVFVTAASFTQTGTTTVNAASMPATIDITLSGANGHATFTNLVAPSAQLFLNLGAGGTTSGLIDVAGLSVSYIPPATPILSTLIGTIGGLAGQSAAGRGYITPQANPDYRFNGCAIASINCVLLSPVIVPIYNPTEDVTIATPHRHREDDDLIIPNVSEEDF